MGNSESTFSDSKSRIPADEITTVSLPSETTDQLPHSLQLPSIVPPILKIAPTERSLSDILVVKSSQASIHTTVDPKVIHELFTTYHDWKEKKVKKISEKQEEIEHKIEVTNAVAAKLLQRFNHSASAMKTASHHLSEAHALQVEIGEFKGRMNEVISNCDALCKRISKECPESISSSIEPFAVFEANSSDC